LYFTGQNQKFLFVLQLQISKNRNVSLPIRGATSSSFRGANFHELYSMTSSCLFNRSTTFSQTVTDKVLFATFLKMKYY